MKRITTLTMAFACLSLPITGSSGEYTDQAKFQLELIELAALTGGWEKTHNDQFDQLNHGEFKSFNLNLSEGITYKVVSACDADCSDLDLILYDENDNEISRDTETDGTPVLEVTPRWTGKFSLQVKMYSCDRNPCYYGIRVLGK